MSNTANTRIFWTSGKDMVEAMNRIGRERPLCDSAHTAYQFMAEGDSLFCITITCYPTDRETAMSAYLDAINREESHDEGMGRQDTSTT